MTEPLSYDAVGATRPDERCWGPTPSRFRRHEEHVHLGVGDVVWQQACHDLMAWSVKTRSGFQVSRARVVPGDVLLRARLGPFRVSEPARVVAVVAEADRVGFAYGTLAGHPVSGEEAFVLTRDDRGQVELLLRSITAPAPRGRWRPLYPVVLVAQQLYRRRYRRALSSHFEDERRRRS